MLESLIDDEEGDLVRISGLHGLIIPSSFHLFYQGLMLFSAAKLGLHRNLYYESSPF